VQRAKELIEESFQSIVPALEEALSSSLEAAKQAPAVLLSTLFLKIV
jgi:hypothetical protein